jgi:hypothetical protein
VLSHRLRLNRNARSINITGHISIVSSLQHKSHLSKTGKCTAIAVTGTFHAASNTCL